MKRIGGARWRKVYGLTGGLGTGKSTVLAMLKKKGAYVLDADAEVRRLLELKPVLKKIRRLFGDTVFDGGNLDRKALAEKIFSRKLDRRRLEKLLHPLVRKEFTLALKRKKGNIAVCDVPLLYESRWPYGFDGVIVVHAPMNVRLERLRHRGFQPKESRSRMRAQWPLSKKVKRANFLIRNGGSIQTTKAQVNSLWDLLMRGSHGTAAT